jgi:hypothetical protein
MNVDYLFIGITGLLWIGGLSCLLSMRKNRAQLGWILLVIGTVIYFVSGGMNLK